MKRKTSILMLTWEFLPRQISQISSYCEGLSKKIAKKQNVEVITFDDWKGSVTEEREKVMVHHITNPQRTNISMLTWALTLNMEFERVASELFYSKNFSLIHANEWMTFPAGVSLKQIFRIPLIITIHSTEHQRCPHSHDSYTSLIKQIEWLACKKANKVIVNDYATMESVIKNYNVPIKKIELVVPNSIGWTSEVRKIYKKVEEEK